MKGVEQQCPLHGCELLTVIEQQQRTQSAGHEALQRRVGERPGDGFSGELVGARLVLSVPFRKETLDFAVAMRLPVDRERP